MTLNYESESGTILYTEECNEDFDFLKVYHFQKLKSMKHKVIRNKEYGYFLTLLKVVSPVTFKTVTEISLL